LIPLRRRTYVPREQVMATFATAAVVDPDRLRADLDDAVEQDPFDRDYDHRMLDVARAEGLPAEAPGLL
jgi:hypothetical protein